MATGSRKEHLLLPFHTLIANLDKQSTVTVTVTVTVLFTSEATDQDASSQPPCIGTIIDDTKNKKRIGSHKKKALYTNVIYYYMYKILYTTYYRK